MHPEITCRLAAYRQAELAQEMSSARPADRTSGPARAHPGRARSAWLAAARRVVAACWLSGAPVNKTPGPVR